MSVSLIYVILILWIFAAVVISIIFGKGAALGNRNEIRTENSWAYEVLEEIRQLS